MVLAKDIEIASSVVVEEHNLFSNYLDREVIYEVFYTPESLKNNPSLLLINDGQDLSKMPFDKLLNNLISSQQIHPVFCVGIHASEERKKEYGTSYAADYKGRGSKAGLYTKFILDELLPSLRTQFKISSFKEKSFAGFSLGGLSALDIVWNHAAEFERVGVFSGSLWWRRKAYDEGYDDNHDRLMHLQVKHGTMFPWLKFFIQTGVLDEKADRNNNGIIDSIDDALDLIAELKSKGYANDSIEYLQMNDGKHDVPTWAKAFVPFLIWGWGK
ncbi:MAG: esterase [Chitinophagaceae bacterium]|nr:esterase [Chitinophagaceae bacterium]